MNFKSPAQRKAVMASMNSGRQTTDSSVVPYAKQDAFSQKIESEKQTRFSNADFWKTYWDEKLDWDSEPEKLYSAKRLSQEDPKKFRQFYSPAGARPMTDREFELAVDELDEALYQYEGR